MNWDFKGRRPLSAKDHLVSIKVPSCEIKCQKCGESMFDGTRSIQSWR